MYCVWLYDVPLCVFNDWNGSHAGKSIMLLFWYLCCIQLLLFLFMVFSFDWWMLSKSCVYVWNPGTYVARIFLELMCPFPYTFDMLQHVIFHTSFKLFPYVNVNAWIPVITRHVFILFLNSIKILRNVVTSFLVVYRFNILFL